MANIKDSNHKVVIAALDALEQLLLRNSDSMVPHLNICFDHTLVKLGDIKVIGLFRMRGMSVLIFNISCFCVF